MNKITNTITLLIGPGGSGKSTWLDKNCKNATMHSCYTDSWNEITDRYLCQADPAIHIFSEGDNANFYRTLKKLLYGHMDSGHQFVTTFQNLHFVPSEWLHDTRVDLIFFSRELAEQFLQQEHVEHPATILDDAFKNTFDHLYIHRTNFFQPCPKV